MPKIKTQSKLQHIGTLIGRTFLIAQSEAWKFWNGSDYENDGDYEELGDYFSIPIEPGNYKVTRITATGEDIELQGFELRTINN